MSSSACRTRLPRGRSNCLSLLETTPKSRAGTANSCRFSAPTKSWRQIAEGFRWFDAREMQRLYMRADRARSYAFQTHADSWIFACNPLRSHCAVSLLLEKKRCFINPLEGTL